MRRHLLTHAVVPFLAAISMALSSMEARAQTAHVVELITAEEASFPEGKPRELRGPIPGPTIEIVSPSPDVAQYSPIRLILRFRAYGGARVDPETIRLVYERSRPVELTFRILPYVTAKGITIDKAKVPPGSHTIRVELKDSQGRLGMKHLKFSVGQ